MDGADTRAASPTASTIPGRPRRDRRLGAASAATRVAARLTFQPDLTQRREEFRRRGLRATLEAFHVWLDQGAAGVEVERDPDRVVENDLLGLLVALHPRRAG